LAARGSYALARLGLFTTASGSFMFHATDSPDSRNAGAGFSKLH